MPAIPTPSLQLLTKIASIVRHAEEYISDDGHDFDKAVIDTLLDDPEVRKFMDEMQAAALVPVKRRG